MRRRLVYCSALTPLLITAMGALEAHADAVVATTAPVAVPVVQASSMVNLAWLANVGMFIASVCVVPVAGYLIQLLSNMSWLKKDARARALVSSVITNGAALAAGKLGTVHINNAPLDVKVAAIAAGVNYAQTGAQSALASLGYDPATVTGAAHLANMIEAKIPEAQAKAGVTTLLPGAAAVVTDLTQGATLMEGPALATEQHAMDILSAVSNVKNAISSIESTMADAKIADPAVPSPLASMEGATVTVTATPPAPAA